MKNEKAILKIRKATIKDIDNLAQLQKEIEEYYDQWRKNPKSINLEKIKTEMLRDGFGKNKCYETHIAFWNKKAVGFFCYYNGYRMEFPAFKILHLLDLYVNETVRGKGVGFSLMQELTDIAKKKNAKQILWTVWKPNKNAIKFYKKIGAEFLEDTDKEKIMVWDVK